SILFFSKFGRGSTLAVRCLSYSKTKTTATKIKPRKYFSPTPAAYCVVAKYTTQQNMSYYGSVSGIHGNRGGNYGAGPPPTHGGGGPHG
ncbi:unnamed protein product, partial [Ectocarpus sp. 12 AP-2014]